MITLAEICEALDHNLNAKVWTEAGYIWLEREGSTVRLSLDRVKYANRV